MICWGSGVICPIPVLYWGDQHKAQTGGVIWSSLKPSPVDWDVEVVMGESGAPL